PTPSRFAEPREIRTVPLAGGTSKVVARVNSGFPGLSPDGSVIVFKDTGMSNQYVFADPTGRQLATYTPPRGGSIDGWLGSSAVIVSNGGTPWRLHAYSIADGRSRILLDTLSGMAAPAWSPDGKRITLGIGNGLRFGLAVMNADGGSVKLHPVDVSVAADT